MCRLFGMHAGDKPAKATFWLLQAPNSLSLQSHHEPDGTGIGTFDADGSALVNKQPLTAWRDRDFATEAKDLASTTFLAHVRYASAGDHTEVNTHPFEQDNRLFAHNGVVGGLEVLDERLEALGVGEIVLGQTDSERIFALITAEIRKAQGDVAEGIRSAVQWAAENLPIYSLNFIMTTATDLWALRYPQTHELFVLDRRTAPNVVEPLHVHSHRIRAHSQDLAQRDVVIVSTEKMTDDQRWRLMESGELIHVRHDLDVESNVVFSQAPRTLMKLEQLGAVAAASQHPVS